MCSTQADNNSRKLLLRCQFSWLRPKGLVIILEGTRNQEYLSVAHSGLMGRTNLKA
jgi:hypothetical protein